MAHDSADSGDAYDLADAEFYRSLDDLVGPDRVDAKRLVIWLDQYPRYRGKMHYDVRRCRRPAAFETVEAEMRGHGIEGLAAVRQIGDQDTDAGMVERLEVDIEKVVALALQMRRTCLPALPVSPVNTTRLPLIFLFRPSLMELVETHCDPASSCR